MGNITSKYMKSETMEDADNLSKRTMVLKARVHIQGTVLMNRLVGSHLRKDWDLIGYHSIVNNETWS